jgi:hypothetical protein
MGPKNGVIGDLDFGTSFPEMRIPERDLTEEKKMARFSKTAEFKRLKGHLEQRIEHYQTMLPDGRALTSVSPQELAEHWLVANAVVAELKLIIASYEQVQLAVAEDALRPRE